MRVPTVSLLPILISAVLSNCHASNDNTTEPETLRVLVCLVQWADHVDRPLIPKEEIEQLWNGPSFTDIVPGESITDYIESNSYGKYRIQADVIDWYLMEETEAEASFGNMGNSLTDRGPFIEDILSPVVVSSIFSHDVSLRDYDRNADGLLRGIVFIHSGYGAEYGGTDCETGADYMDRIISKTWGTVERIGNSAYKIIAMVTLSAYRGTCGLEIDRIGVWVHEWLHGEWGLEDLYDTGGRYQGSRSAPGGIGGFGIMSYAGGQAYRTEYPGILSPYSKMKIGALNPIEIKYDGTYTARASASFPDVFMISAPYEDGEYLLIENRQRILSDKFLWEPGGLVIYHVDENMEGYGNRYRGGPFLEGWPGNGDHYKVAVLQADSKYELEKALNLGHNADFWKAGDLLGPGNGELVATDEGIYPNTDSYVGGKIRVTGLVIDNFKETEPGVWSFRVKNLAEPPISDSPTMAPFQATSSPSDPQASGWPSAFPSRTEAPSMFTTQANSPPTPTESPSGSPSAQASLSFLPSEAPSEISSGGSATPTESLSSAPSLQSLLSLLPSTAPSSSPTIAPFASDSSPPVEVPSDDSSAAVSFPKHPFWIAILMSLAGFYLL